MCYNYKTLHVSIVTPILEKYKQNSKTLNMLLKSVGFYSVPVSTLQYRSLTPRSVPLSSVTKSTRDWLLKSNQIENFNGWKYRYHLFPTYLTQIWRRKHKSTAHIKRHFSLHNGRSISVLINKDISIEL